MYQNLEIFGFFLFKTRSTNFSLLNRVLESKNEQTPPSSSRCTGELKNGISFFSFLLVLVQWREIKGHFSTLHCTKSPLQRFAHLFGLKIFWIPIFGFFATASRWARFSSIKCKLKAPGHFFLQQLLFFSRKSGFFESSQSSGAAKTKIH